jgi:hypothetical protein
MPKEELDAPQINPRFQSGCGEGMAQQMWVNELREVRGLPGASADYSAGQMS